MSSPPKTQSASERLKSFRGELGASQQDLADRLSLPQRTYAAYERGRLPPHKVLTDLADLGLDLHWLIVGESSTGPPASLERVQPTVRVPIYAAHLGASTPGGGGEPTDEIVSYGDIWVEWLRNEARVDPARSFIATVYGSSMLKLYADRDLVIGETVEELTRDGTYACGATTSSWSSTSRARRRESTWSPRTPASPPLSSAATRCRRSASG